MIKNKKLVDKLYNLEIKFEKIEKFAKKLPICSDYIIDNEIIESHYNKLGNEYKSIYLGWGINRAVYGDNRTVTNCKLDYDGKILTNIYINTLTQYDRHNNYGLEAIADKVFFFDSINTTFYATDEELEGLLEALNDWYLIASEQACKDNKTDKLLKLEKTKQQLLREC